MATAGQRDVVIAGGGMVGLSLALQLGERAPPGTSITLVEGFALRPPGSADYHPSFDARSTALSYSSRLIYQDMGLWSGLEQWLSPIETIHVSMKGRFGSSVMSANDYGWPALGYVVENAWLGQALLRAVHQQGRVELVSPARVTSARPSPDGFQLRLQGADAGELDTRLLVVADGAGSSLRDELGIAMVEKPYRQSAVIANVVTGQPHRGCAFERFTDQGPLALLPLLPAPGGEHRSALVWTQPPERADELITCPDAEFIDELQRRFGYRLGRLTQVGERHSYPLSLVQAAEQVRRGLVVMGNAAHALHPVAGQGFNLALRDVDALTAEIAPLLARGGSPGELAHLQRYQRRARPDQQQTIAFSDRVPGVFMRTDPVFSLARDLALSGLDLLPPAKREFVRRAAGVGADG